MSDKILIADDEPSNRKILAQEITHKGFAVDMARGGREAFGENRIRSAGFDDSRLYDAGHERPRRA